MANIVTADQIKQEVSLVDLLAKLGHRPSYRSGKELFYKSMLREERTPSLCVNKNLNVWFDHGGAGVSQKQGGNVIDFALAYWFPSDFGQVLKKISETMLLDFPANIPPASRPRKTTSQSEKLTNYKVTDVKEIGGNQRISAYLKDRGIFNQAKGRIKEVYYEIVTGPKAGKSFFCAGWQNDLGSWELSNKGKHFKFKACLGRKAITTITGSESRITLFEGYMDYLSWLADNPKATDSVIVLNSVNLLEPALSKIASFSSVQAYFDRDKAGEKAFLQLKGAVPHAQDRSSLYRKYKDYNDMFINRPSPNVIYEESHIYEKMMSAFKR
ncbi:toprim domain-containing protein [Sphingobacterium bambusae]|uniref:Toprim domain-containing protein n=1 Tax=Sphingobacterium bambusae TaxID=662858 RepID=A0ABW6B9M7_9SPHI|nr:toprim domain-containing protein [Sphingobacterium bambusae]WPL48512.1 toprim domain-containing protein [Sphingobacterium bambusae]